MSSKTNNNDQDKLLHIASEAINSFESFVNEWLSPTEEYSKSHIILSFLNSYAKSTAILSHIDALSDDIQPIVELIQFKKRYDQTSSKIKTIFNTNGSLISQLFQKGGGLWEQIDILDEMIEDIVTMNEDINLYDNELILDDLRLTTSDFILRFTDIGWVIKEPPEFIATCNFFENWKKRFQQTEKKFKTHFHIFSMIEDVQQTLYLHENNVDFWWLTTSFQIPETESDIEKEIDFFESIYTLGKETEKICPWVDMTFSFANSDPISINNRKKIKEHLKICRSCRNLVSDIRFADDSAQMAKESPLLSPEIWNKIFKSFIDKIPARRLHTPKENQAFDFSLGVLPEFKDYSKPFEMFQPEYCDTYEKLSHKIPGFVVWVKNSIEQKRIAVDITILYKTYYNNELTLSGQVDISILERLFPLSEQQCEWQTKKGKFSPEKIVFDAKTGYFTIIFRLPDDIPGQLAFWFIINS